MDARSLGYFLAVVDHGGFVHAADALHVAQPSLSQAIARLERELGVELFHRVGRGVVLSDAGSALVLPARQVLRDLEVVGETLASVKGLARGAVHIAAMSSPGIEPLGAMVRALHETHPGLVVHAAAAFDPQEAVKMVREGLTELGIVGTPAPVTAPGLVVHPVEAEPFILVSREEVGCSGLREIALADVGPLRVVASPVGSLMRAIVDDAVAAGAPVEIAAEVAHRTSVLPFVLRGIGAAVVPSSWAALARAASLRVVRLSHPARLHVALLRRDAPLSPAAEAFLETARALRRSRVEVDPVMGGH